MRQAAFLYVQTKCVTGHTAGTGEKNEPITGHRHDRHRDQHHPYADRYGLSVKDVQDVFGFSTPQAVYKWQRGTALPTVDNLVVLAALFGVKIDDILIFQDCGAIPISA